MKVLLHTCCGPCALFPVRELRVDGMTVTGFLVAMSGRSLAVSP